jgi:hypothetical protein
MVQAMASSEAEAGRPCRVSRSDRRVGGGIGTQDAASLGAATARGALPAVGHANPTAHDEARGSRFTAKARRTRRQREGRAQLGSERRRAGSRGSRDRGRGLGRRVGGRGSSALAREPAPVLGPIFADLRALRAFAVRTGRSPRGDARPSLPLRASSRGHATNAKGATTAVRAQRQPHAGVPVGAASSRRERPRRSRGRRLAEVDHRSVGPRLQQGILADLDDRARRSPTSARNRPNSLAEVDHRRVGPPLRQAARAPVPHSESGRVVRP